MFMENQLPAYVIAQLFNKNLVLTDESNNGVSHSQCEGKKNNESQTVLPKIWWLGENKKNIVILLKDGIHKFISDENLQFLISILNACHFTTDDIAIVNITKTPVDYIHLKNTFSPAVILLFDVQPEKLHITTKSLHYIPFTYDNCHLLTSVSLDELNGNTSAKKIEKGKLWNGLKKLFNI